MRWPGRRVAPVAPAAVAAPTLSLGLGEVDPFTAALWLLRNTSAPTPVILAHYLDRVVTS